MNLIARVKQAYFALMVDQMDRIARMVYSAGNFSEKAHRQAIPFWNASQDYARRWFEATPAPQRQSLVDALVSMGPPTIELTSEEWQARCLTVEAAHQARQRKNAQ